MKLFYLDRIKDNQQDKDALILWMKDKEIYDTTLTVPFPYKEEHALHFINRAKDSKYDFVIRNNDHQLIGTIGIAIDAIQPHKAILGYWLAKPYWNKGIVTEAVKEITKLSFQEFKLDRLSASCFENNIGSARVLEKAGFLQEGLMVNHYKKDGKLHNAKLFGKIP